MDSTKAVCECKNFSESDKVIAIRQKPLETWGLFSWTFVLLLVLGTGGGAFPFVLGWVLGGYWLNPTYRCQFCRKAVNKNQFRS